MREQHTTKGTEEQDGMEQPSRGMYLQDGAPDLGAAQVDEVYPADCDCPTPAYSTAMDDFATSEAANPDTLLEQSEAVEQFSAGISHDRQDLPHVRKAKAVVSGALNAVEESAVEDDVAEVMDASPESGGRSLRRPSGPTLRRGRPKRYKRTRSEVAGNRYRTPY